MKILKIFDDSILSNSSNLGVCCGPFFCLGCSGLENMMYCAYILASICGITFFTQLVRLLILKKQIYKQPILDQIICTYISWGLFAAIGNGIMEITGIYKGSEGYWWGIGWTILSIIAIVIQLLLPPKWREVINQD